MKLGMKRAVAVPSRCSPLRRARSRRGRPRPELALLVAGNDARGHEARQFVLETIHRGDSGGLLGQLVGGD